MVADIKQIITDYKQKTIKNLIRCSTRICPRCHQKPAFFKRHDVRQRQLRVIVGRFIESVLLLLIRMKCPRCGKTFTDYPPFALPYKRFVSWQILERALWYLQDDAMTYEQATRQHHTDIPNGRAPPQQPMPVFYPDVGKAPSLAPSTVYRWITTLGSLKKTLQAATNLLLDKDADIHRHAVDIAARKFRSAERKNRLKDALSLLHAEAAYRAWFGCSIFPQLATSCQWQ